MKRIFDILIAFIGLLFLLPFFFIISLILKLTGEGNVFYRQERIGKEGKKFGILKFATMLKDSPNLGNGMLTVRNDPRITKAGRILRLTKLNELPQLWNVLIGEMSFVGPRPLTEVGISRYDQTVSQTVLKLRPGITGIGSLVFRDEEKLVSLCKENGGDPKAYYREHIFPYKGKVECWYASNQSFNLDVLLLMATLYSVFFNDRNIAFKLFKDLPVLTKELTLAHFNQEKQPIQ